jgi:hypothetical protein
MMVQVIILIGIEGPSESVVLTFWESIEDMDSFYQADNRLLSSLVKELEPSFETLPERISHRVSDFKI